MMLSKTFSSLFCPKRYKVYLNDLATEFSYTYTAYVYFIFSARHTSVLGFLIYTNMLFKRVRGLSLLLYCGVRNEYARSVFLSCNLHPENNG